MRNSRKNGKPKKNRRSDSPQTTGKTTAPYTVVAVEPGIPPGTPVGALVQQPQGGAIRNGGTNAGGPGRPPSHIRAAYVNLLSEQGIAFLASVLKGDAMVKVKDKDGNETGTLISAPLSDRLKAVELCNRYGLGVAGEKVIRRADPEVTQRIAATYDAFVLAGVPPDTVRRIILDVWRTTGEPEMEPAA